MRRRRSVLFFALFSLLAALPAPDVHGMGRMEAPSASSSAVSSRSRTVEHVTDGDTLILDGGERIRLIGIDTPEMHDEDRNGRTARREGLNARLVDDYSSRARDFLEKTLSGRSVRLEYDQERKDKYGRTLAYVYREPDGLFVNAEMLKEGYGFAYTRFPFKYTEEFRRLEREAKGSRTGLWSGRS
jgi:micrococcal nuclease